MNRLYCARTIEKSTKINYVNSKNSLAGDSFKFARTAKNLSTKEEKKNRKKEENIKETQILKNARNADVVRREIKALILELAYYLNDLDF